MNISDRIQALRKLRGISQGELADKIGVSRQAVSKWESEQSTPDIDKIIILSEYFEVSTDYILKGIETEKPTADTQANAGIFVMVATALNFVGLVISCGIWYEQQTPMATVIGLVIMAVGCFVYGIGMFVSLPSTKTKAKFYFWMVNIWLISFIPLSVLYNSIFTHTVAPYPTIVQPLIAFPLFFLVYAGISLVVTLTIRKNMQ